MPLHRLTILSGLFLLASATAVLIAGPIGGSSKGQVGFPPKPTQNKGSPMPIKADDGTGLGRIALVLAETRSPHAIGPGQGTLKGKVTLAGDMPDIAAMNAELLKLINEKATPTVKPHCLAQAPEDQKTQQDWRINKDNRGVANVFVFLKPPPGKFFALEEKDPAVQAVKNKPISLDQPHCAFVPHALILFPSYHDPQNKERPTGQKFIIKNSAKIVHNVKYGDDGGKNPGSNITLAAGSQREMNDFRPSNDPVDVACSVHPWMSANIWVRDNPYYAITDKDGNYEIKNVPEGKVRIVAWHGKAKFRNPEGGKGSEITLTREGGVKDFDIKAK